MPRGSIRLITSGIGVLRLYTCMLWLCCSCMEHDAMCPACISVVCVDILQALLLDDHMTSSLALCTEIRRCAVRTARQLDYSTEPLRITLPVLGSQQASSLGAEDPLQGALVLLMRISIRGLYLDVLWTRRAPSAVSLRVARSLRRSVLVCHKGDHHLA